MEKRFENLLANDEAMAEWGEGHGYHVEWANPEAREEFRASTWFRHVEWKEEMARELEAMMRDQA